MERPGPLGLPGPQALPVPGRCDLGEQELELHATEGHTADGMAVWVPWASVLVAGDYLSPVEIPMISGGGSLSAYLATLERLEPVVEQAAHVVPGHGGRDRRHARRGDPARGPGVPGGAARPRRGGPAAARAAHRRAEGDPHGERRRRRGLTLSVLVPTHDPAPRIAAIVAPLREVADEIVIALDHRMDLDRLGAYEPLADKLLRFEHTGEDLAPGWLHRQCTGDWVLTLAGDEVPSAALVAALPELCADRELRQYWLPVRWVWPDPEHWLDELPWAPGLPQPAAAQRRPPVVRGPDALGRLAGAPGALRGGAGLPPRRRAAVGVRAGGEGAPLRREAPRPDRARRRGAQRALLPARAPRAAPARRGAARGPRAPGRGRRRCGRRVPSGPPRRRRWRSGCARTSRPTAGARRCRRADYRASIRVLERDHRMLAGETRNVFAAVRNLGAATWPWGAAPAARDPDVLPLARRRRRDASSTTATARRSPPRSGPARSASSRSR